VITITRRPKMATNVFLSTGLFFPSGARRRGEVSCARYPSHALRQVELGRRWCAFVPRLTPNDEAPERTGARGLRRNDSAYWVTFAQSANGCTEKLVLPLGLKIHTSHELFVAGKEASTVLLVPLVSGFM
jgi:hypothetical protein